MVHVNINFLAFDRPRVTRTRKQARKIFSSYMKLLKLSSQNKFPEKIFDKWDYYLSREY